MKRTRGKKNAHNDTGKTYRKRWRAMCPTKDTYDKGKIQQAFECLKKSFREYVEDNNQTLTVTEKNRRLHTWFEWAEECLENLTPGRVPKFLMMFIKDKYESNIVIPAHSTLEVLFQVCDCTGLSWSPRYNR